MANPSESPDLHVVLSDIRKNFTAPDGKIFEALKGINMEIKRGESFSLLGPSGCGKSTLLRIIAGMEQPDSGRVILEGRDCTDLPPEKRPTAMVFQNYALFPHLTVEGNVAFGLKLRKLSRSEIRRKVDEVLEKVQLSGLNARKMSELSGGQQQRVALARVLAIEPSILLMDEPLSNLDASLRRTTRSTIRRLQSELGLTLIYVTHDQDEALMISDRLAVMDAGRILQAGTPEELYENPSSAMTAGFLGQRNMIPVTVDQVEGKKIWLVTGAANSGRQRSRLELHGSAEWPFRAGERAQLALKPDDVILNSAGGSNEGWPGEIVLSSFAGTLRETEARLAETGQTLRVSHSAREITRDFVRRDAVLVSVREGSGLLFPIAGDAASD